MLMGPSSNGDKFIQYCTGRLTGPPTMGMDVHPPITHSRAEDDDSRTSYDVPNLVNGTTYIFQVRAENENDGGQMPSDTAEATPAGPLPRARELSVSVQTEPETGASNCRGRCTQ